MIFRNFFQFKTSRKIVAKGAIVLCLSCLSPGSVLAQSPGDEPQTGKELAKQLRTMYPGGNAEIAGVLIIDDRERIPVVCNIITNSDSWKVIYQTRPMPDQVAEKFVTVHSLTGPNKYFYARAPHPGASLPELKSIKPADAAISFAGSDFWLSELGFDFLHWPVQNKLPGQMRLGQACYVLESINPDGPVVVRMKSYIDKDSYEKGTPGILIAEGYDRKKRLIKDFSLGGSSFKKVNGQWQLKKMKIRSPKEDSETVLEFDLPEEKND